jgi:hypothetical protein
VVRIAISQAAFEAIAAASPLASTGFDRSSAFVAAQTERPLRGGLSDVE